MKNKIYAIIPARKGSKRIPDKNKKDFCGKPLVAWTIEAAKGFKLINSIVLSSDDDETLHLLETKTLIEYRDHRPKELSRDDSSPIELVKYLIKKYKMTPEDIIIYLQPTSPLRTSEDIKIAYYSFTMFRDCESLISCVRAPNLYYGFTMDQGYLSPCFHGRWLDKRSQDLPDAFIPNGAIYIIRVKHLLLYESFYTPLTKPLIMSAYNSVNIDEMEDWIYAEFLMRTRLSKQYE